jgi:hypothetical protein
MSQTENTYTVRWSDAHGYEYLVCTNLDPRTFVARLMSGVRNRGPITIHEVTVDQKPL